MFSYDGLPHKISGPPTILPPEKAFPALTREQKWAEIDLCPQVTNLGYGQAEIKGVNIEGFYFQAGDSSARNVANNVGLPVFKLGDQVFFSPEHLWGPLGEDLFDRADGSEDNIMQVVQDLVDRVKSLEEDHQEMGEKMGGESALPEGDFTWSTGSNYGLDGFFHTDNYGEGKEEGVRWDGGGTQERKFEHPQTGGYGRLPDGTIKAGADEMGCLIEAPSDLSRIEDGFNLMEMFGESSFETPESIAKLAEQVDLVALAQGADLADMVKAGALEPGALSDLEWLDPYQIQDPTRLPYTDFDSLSELHEIWDANKPARQNSSINLVPGTQDREAAAYYRSIEAIPQENPLDRKLANDRFKSVLQHALRRASYGEPLSVISEQTVSLLGPQERTKKAMTLLANEHGLLGNVYIRASSFPGIESGKWAKEIKKRASGARYIVATEGTTLAEKQVFMGKKVVLEIPWKEAFQHYAPRLLSTGHVIPNDGSYKDRLRAAFQNGPLTNDEPRVAQGLPTWVPPADTISLEEAKRLAASMPVQEQEVLDPTPKFAEQRRKKALVQIAQWVKSQLLSREDALKISASEKDPHKLLRKASSLILARQQRVYQGEGEGALAAEQKRSRSAGRIRKGEVDTMIRWARIQMTEGSVGEELDQLLRVRFSEPIRKAAHQLLEETRDFHEGLSGHVYVDVGAYASKVGTEGCEAGAMKHRANNLKFALEMERCASCVHKNASPAGDVCQKYNKILVADAPVEDPAAYQQEAIRLANASDAEVTAALFNNYDEGFDLGNGLLDNIQLNASTNAEGLGDILWGGMILE